MKKTFMIAAGLIMAMSVSACGSDKSGSSASSAASEANSKPDKRFEEMAGEYTVRNVNVNGTVSGFDTAETENRFKDMHFSITAEGKLMIDGGEYTLKAKKSDMFDYLVCVTESGYDGSTRNGKGYTENDYEGPVWFNYGAKGTDPFAYEPLEEDYIDMYYSLPGTENWVCSMDCYRCD